MPTYDFRCDACGAQAEVTYSIRETPIPPDCPRCLTPMRRRYAAPGVEFRGEGWAGPKVRA